MHSLPSSAPTEPRSTRGHTRTSAPCSQLCHGLTMLRAHSTALKQRSVYVCTMSHMKYAHAHPLSHDLHMFTWYTDFTRLHALTHTPCTLTNSHTCFMFMCSDMLHAHTHKLSHKILQAYAHTASQVCSVFHTPCNMHMTLHVTPQAHLCSHVYLC